MVRRSIVPDIIRDGLIKTPLPVSATYKGKRFTATINWDGTIAFQGKSYPTLSAAAGVARMTVIGNPPTRGQQRPYPQTNGWTFWKYLDPETGKLEKIDRIRRRYLYDGW